MTTTTDLLETLRANSDPAGCDRAPEGLRCSGVRRTGIYHAPWWPHASR
jgi:hypothetical protein